jgi:hypothetical protein
MRKEVMPKALSGYLSSALSPNLGGGLRFTSSGYVIMYTHFPWVVNDKVANLLVQHPFVDKGNSEVKHDYTHRLLILNYAEG